jgi:cytochrome b pre-mRNA-processing protein 3
MLNAMRKSKQRKAQAAGLYAAVTRRAREPEFFARFAVEDTLDGRFDLLTLHAGLVLERLKAAGAAPLSQAFVDAVFIGFDEALRELGSGDIGMGKRMKKLADAFYGRLQAYGEAKDEAALEDALVRNLYRGARLPAAKAMARYMLSARAQLDGCDLETLDFGPLPDEE